MRFSALQSAGFALQVSESRFLNFDFAFQFFENFKNFENFVKFCKKTSVEKNSIRNLIIYFRRVVEQSLLIPMPQTALLYRINSSRSLILNSVILLMYNCSGEAIKLLPMHYHTCLALNPRRKPDIIHSLVGVLF